MSKGFDLYQDIDEAIASGALREAELWVIGRWPVKIAWRKARTFPPCVGRKLAGLLRQCHGYVTGSRYEPGAMHPVEGLQCGLPLLYDPETGGTVELGRRFGIEVSDDPVMAFTRFQESYDELRQRVLARPTLRRRDVSRVPKIDSASHCRGTPARRRLNRHGIARLARDGLSILPAGRRSSGRWTRICAGRGRALDGDLRLTSRWRSRIVHAAWWPSAWLLGTEVLRSRKVVCFSDNAPSFYARQPEFHAVRPFVDKWIARSRQAVREFLSFGIQAELAPYCVGSEGFFSIASPEDAEVQALRQQLGLPADCLCDRKFSFRHGVHSWT